MAKTTLSEKIFAPAKHGYPGFTLRCDAERTLGGLSNMWQSISKSKTLLTKLNAEAGLGKAAGLSSEQLAGVAKLLKSMEAEVAQDTQAYTDSLESE